MSETKKTDHWLDLASEIGADVPEEPVVEQQQPSLDEAEPETVLAEEPEAQEPETAQAEEPTCEVEEQPLQAAEPVEDVAEVTFGAPPEPELDSPESERPTSAAPSHWYELATDLGLDVPKPEPEPEPEPVAEEPATPEPSDKAPEPQGRSEDAASDERQEATDSPGQELPETASPEMSDSAQPERQPPPNDSPRTTTPSLFEHPDLRLDAPGVLDAVFDGDEEAVFNAIGGRTPSREVESSSIAEEEKSDESSEFAREVEEFAEEGRDAEENRDVDEDRDVEEEGRDAEEGRDVEEEDDDVKETATDGVEVDDSKASDATDDQERSGRRRKRRRRRRPARRGRGEAAEGADEETAEGADGAEAESEDSVAEEESEIAASRVTGRESEPHDMEDAAAVKAKHKKIPTWEEAVGFIVSSNVENRSKTSSYGPRGRGRRGRR